MTLREQLAKCDLCNGTGDTLPGMDSQGYHGDACPKCMEIAAKWLILHCGNKVYAQIFIDGVKV